MKIEMLKTTALGTCLSLALALPAVAQSSSGDSAQSGQSGSQTTQSGDAPQSVQSGGQAQLAGGPAPESVVAKVGDVEILGSDVMTVIGMLPPQLQSQPPQMLVPMALQQLVLRELVLEEARGQNLAEDPEVISLVEGSTQTAEEDAMVQVWIEREMANAVTDEAVQSTYEQAAAQGQQNLPPVEEVRPQIEQYLRQQAMQSIGMRLQEGVEIVLYDAMGQPVEQGSGGASGSTTGGSGNASGGQTTGSDASGSSDTTGTTAPKN